jgi:predicted HTH domain antitoxin
MQFTMVVPDSVAHSLRFNGEQAGRKALEMVALEGYRSGDLSRGQVGEMLNLSYHETEQFLFDNHAMIRYTVEELEQGSANLRTFFS